MGRHVKERWRRLILGPRISYHRTIWRVVLVLAAAGLLSVALTAGCAGVPNAQAQVAAPSLVRLKARVHGYYGAIVARDPEIASQFSGPALGGNVPQAEFLKTLERIFQDDVRITLSDIAIWWEEPTHPTSSLGRAVAALRIRVDGGPEVSACHRTHWQWQAIPGKGGDWFIVAMAMEMEEDRPDCPADPSAKPRSGANAPGFTYQPRLRLRPHREAGGFYGFSSCWP